MGNLVCADAASILRRAISMYSASRSIPMNSRPSITQATPVVPLPMKGSSTTSPGLATRRTSQRINWTGLQVGCKLPCSRTLALILSGVSDTTVFAPRTDSACSFVVVSDWLSDSALAARLMPQSGSVLSTAAMDSLMGCEVQTDEVFKTVVLLVSVDVVD